MMDSSSGWLAVDAKQETSMSQNVIYVGVDIDDVRYRLSALDQSMGEVLDFNCLATLRSLVQRIEKFREYFAAEQLKVCYETPYVGFSLQRDLADRGYCCDIVAPSSIRRRGGKSVKTDRIDATELSEFYAKRLLTIVSAPDT